MPIIAIINKQAGTLRTMQHDDYADHLKTVFLKNGDEIEIRFVQPDQLLSEFDRASKSDFDTILACGGDGTITCAASACVRGNKTLGVIPGGTMNLFARSLGMPLDPLAAAEALVGSIPSPCDYATANNHLFLHQYSVGMQPALVRKRSRYRYDSRLGKIFASLRATAEMVFSPPKFQCETIIDGKEQSRALSMIAVSNNLHTEGHLPYPDKLNEHVLGVYSCPPVNSSAGAKLVSDLLMGNWSTNDDLTIEKAEEVHLRFSRIRKNKKALIDGELVPLEPEVKIRTHPDGLNVLLPVNDNQGLQDDA